MPTGPKGEKRPADVIANAVLSMKIATGEAEERYVNAGQSQTDTLPIDDRGWNMDDQQIREIAEAAFRAQFDIDVVRVNIRHGFDFQDDRMPVVDLTVIYDGKFEQLNGAGLLYVDREIMDKMWRNAEDPTGWPLVHFMPKSEIGRRDPATVFSGPAPYGCTSSG